MNDVKEFSPVARRVAWTTTRKTDGEYHVKAYDQWGNRWPQADYFTTDRQDAEETARRMTEAR